MSTQSAAERRAAEAEVGKLVAKFSPTQKALVGTLRRSLHKRLPTAHEVVYAYRDCFVLSFTPTGQGYEGVLVIRGSARGVDLYLSGGKDLPDPEKLLRGSAKKVRFIPIENAATLKRVAVKRLIEEAIARNRVPFAPAGRGPVTIR